MSEYIEIQTHELAQLINGVSRRVEATTDAVNEMRNCVAEAEREAASTVCSSVNQGFFALIRSQLMQKKVQVQATVESSFLALRHFAQSLTRIRHQMSVDFERITQRYAKLFNTLEESLRSRVYTLDRLAAEAADIDYNILNRRVLTTGAPIAVMQGEVSASQNELSVVRCKRGCQNVLVGVTTLIQHGIRLNKAMSDIIRPVSQDCPHSVNIPVVVVEQTNLFVEDADHTEFFLPQDNPTTRCTTLLRTACFEGLSRLIWKPVDATMREAVTQRVKKLLGGNVNSRIRTHALTLLEKSELERLEAVQ